MRERGARILRCNRVVLTPAEASQSPKDSRAASSARLGEHVAAKSLVLAIAATRAATGLGRWSMASEVPARSPDPALRRVVSPLGEQRSDVAQRASHGPDDPAQPARCSWLAEEPSRPRPRAPIGDPVRPGRQGLHPHAGRSIGVLGEATHEQPATSCIVAPRVSESSRVVDHPLQPGRWGGVAGFALTASTEMRGAPEGVGSGGRRVGEEGWASRRTGKETVQGTRRGLANQNDDATSQPLGLRERMRS